MKLETYPFKRINEFDYEFYSIGPNGTIRKTVEFRHLIQLEIEIFNIAIGDWENEIQSLNYSSVSNNRDTEKILATVALIAMNFMTRHPLCYLFIEGSNLSRSRLYRSKISKFLNEISQYSKVYGRINDDWEVFKKEVNYNAFLFRPE